MVLHLIIIIKFIYAEIIHVCIDIVIIQSKNHDLTKNWPNHTLKPATPKSCNFFPSSDSFYDSSKQMPLIETPPLPLMLLYLCFSPWVSDLGSHASKGGANTRPLKKFNFSFSSTLIKIIICLSCKGVVVAAVYQRFFNLVHQFFENRSLIQNMSEIGTPPLSENKVQISDHPMLR